MPLLLKSLDLLSVIEQWRMRIATEGSQVNPCAVPYVIYRDPITQAQVKRVEELGIENSRFGFSVLCHDKSSDTRSGEESEYHCMRTSPEEVGSCVRV